MAEMYIFTYTYFWKIQSLVDPDKHSGVSC